MEKRKKSAVAFIRHILDVTELHYICHLCQVFFSDGSESNIEFGKDMFSIKNEPTITNVFYASET